MGVVLLVVAVFAVNGIAIATLLRRRGRSLPIASFAGGGSNGALEPPRGQLNLATALRTLAVRVLLALACALGAASVVFAVWAVPDASSQPPAQVLALSFGFLPLFMIAVIANTIITMGVIPKAERDPLSINAALYRRFARRSSRRVKRILATILVLAMPLAATGVIAKAPSGLLGGVSLEFYVITVAMLLALLPEPTPVPAKAGISGTPRHGSSAQ